MVEAMNSSPQPSRAEHVLALLQRGMIWVAGTAEVIAFVFATVYDEPWIWVTLFFSAPAAILALFLLSLARYVICRRRIKPVPYAVRAWLTVTAILVGVLIAVAVTLVALFALAVRYM